MEHFVRNTNEEYHASEGISSSGIKLLARRPVHFWQRYINPEREREEGRKRHFVVGSAFHCAVLESDEFHYRYAIEPDIPKQSNQWRVLQEMLADPDAFDGKYTAIPDGLSKTSKEGKELVASIEAVGKKAVEQGLVDKARELLPSLHGRELITKDEYDAVMSMAVAFINTPAGQYIIGLKGHRETSIYWTDPETGVLCKFRPDFFVEPCKALPNGLIIDLKSTTDASPEEFGRSAYNFEYHVSAAWYCRGFQQVFKTAKLPPFLYGAVEKEAPYAPACYSATEEQLLLGGKICTDRLRIYADCLRTGQWPGYAPQITNLPLPQFALRQVAELIGAKE